MAGPLDCVSLNGACLSRHAHVPDSGTFALASARDGLYAARLSGLAGQSGMPSGP